MTSFVIDLSEYLQVPRTSELYVHRSGRTARAANEGLSLLLIGPDDLINFRKIYKTLQKSEELPLFPVETKYMTAIKVKKKKKTLCILSACLFTLLHCQSHSLQVSDDIYSSGPGFENEVNHTCHSSPLFVVSPQ